MIINGVNHGIGELIMTKTKNHAFTLAEVLITIGIIGIVAAMTIPNLITKYRKKATVTKLKKVYSTLSQAYKMAVNEEGTPDNWNPVGTDSGEGANNILSIFAKYLKFQSICGTEENCFPDVKYKNLTDAGYQNFNKADWIAKAVLLDGTLLYFQVNSADCSGYNGRNQYPLNNNCGTVAADINGFDKPNHKGKDLFYFMINQSGIYPFGSKDDKIVPFETKCYKNGFSCAAWVIYNENMDYLHCDDLSWDGKLKCR